VNEHSTNQVNVKIVSVEKTTKLAKLKRPDTHNMNCRKAKPNFILLNTPMFTSTTPLVLSTEQTEYYPLTVQHYTYSSTFMQITTRSDYAKQ